MAYIGNKYIPFVYQGNNMVYPSPIKNGLILWYAFQGITNSSNNRGIAKDLSNSGNNGELKGFAYNTLGSGYNQNTIQFDGVDDHILLDNPLFSQGISNQNWTVNIFINPQEILTTTTYMVKGFNLGIGLRVLNGKNLVLNYINNPSTSYLYSRTNIELNKPIMITCSYSYITREVKNYYDGILTDSQIIPTGEEPSGMEPKLYISRYRNEYMYSLQIYNRALTDSEVKECYDIEKERLRL